MKEEKPVGALAVVIGLATVILFTWFLTYGIYLART
jgi:hypothetical protein